MARACIDMGFYISIPGSITFKNAGGLREVVEKIPLDVILVETDAPFLTPEPFRGKRNEPAFVRYTAQKISEVKKIDFDRVVEVTGENALKAFKIKSS